MNPEIIERAYTLNCALGYAERGWSVIPLIGKKPAEAWKEYQEHQPPLGKLYHWWGALQDGGYNIGIVTGKASGLIVVDCETLEEGRKFYREHPTELICRTGRGVHLYYGYAPQGNRARVDGQPLDVRGDGGYVVAPPSVHSSGKEYEWVEYGDPAPFDPAWVSEPEPVKVEKTVGNARSYIAKIVAVSGQGGHDATFRAACKLRDAGLKEEEAFAELVLWNETNAQPKWKPKELLHKVKDAYRRAG